VEQHVGLALVGWRERNDSAAGRERDVAAFSVGSDSSGRECSGFRRRGLACKVRVKMDGPRSGTSKKKPASQKP
jgi:hypothetical protein